MNGRKRNMSERSTRDDASDETRKRKIVSRVLIATIVILQPYMTHNLRADRNSTEMKKSLALHRIHTYTERDKRRGRWFVCIGTVTHDSYTAFIRKIFFAIRQFVRIMSDRKRNVSERSTRDDASEETRKRKIVSRVLIATIVILQLYMTYNLNADRNSPEMKKSLAPLSNKDTLNGRKDASDGLCASALPHTARTKPSSANYFLRSDSL